MTIDATTTHAGQVSGVTTNTLSKRMVATDVGWLFCLQVLCAYLSGNEQPHFMARKLYKCGTMTVNNICQLQKPKTDNRVAHRWCFTLCSQQVVRLFLPAVQVLKFDTVWWNRLRPFSFDTKSLDCLLHEPVDPCNHFSGGVPIT